MVTGLYHDACVGKLFITKYFGKKCDSHHADESNNCNGLIEIWLTFKKYFNTKSKLYKN